MEAIENPMVVVDDDIEFEQRSFADLLASFDDRLLGPAFVRQYPPRRCADVRVLSKYL